MKRKRIQLESKEGSDQYELFVDESNNNTVDANENFHDISLIT